MAHYPTTHPTDSVAVASTVYARLKRRIVTARRASERRHAARSLSHLDSHILRDIGLSRDDLRRSIR
jgi:uncharacterized protein YjiS (DUF1127 family)